ncbi:MAG: hypothetical protein R2824_02515 [Saprospiraceae bacterium]
MKTLVSFTLGLVILLLFQACGNSSSTEQWNTLAENTNKGQYQAPNPPIIYKSEVFSLTDQPARIVYEYESPDPDFGAFSVFIVEEFKDSQVDGAMPQLIVGNGKANGSQPVEFLSPGRYYLEISGMGDWDVKLEQLQ